MKTATATGTCIGTPVSWLRLERYEAGDLDDAERRAIAEHLGACDVCAACAKELRDDDGARELAALPRLPAPAAGKQGSLVVSLRRAAPAVAVFAAAAAVLLVVSRTPREDDRGARYARVKGTDVAFTLVRDDETVVGEAGAARYRDGDRFKALVTCPPGMRASFDLAVYEGSDAAFPLEAQPDLACGNAVALPGAFRVTGRERMSVCLVWSAMGTVDREAVRRTPPEALPHALCKSLEPAP
jgi:hypothetical protein